MKFESLEHVRTWEGESSFIDGKPFKLELFYHHRDFRGPGARDVLAYRFHHGEELIFEGDDFSPGPGYALDGDDTVAALLSFLSLQPGDTDDEWFNSYTPRQMEWAIQHGEDLSWVAMEMEERLEAGK